MNGLDTLEKRKQTIATIDIRHTPEFYEAVLREAFKEIIRRKEEFLWNYEPHRMQEMFHKSTARIRLFLGGNRSGKTIAGLTESIWHALGEHPWNPKFHKRPAKVWIVGLDRVNMLTGKLIPEVEKMIPGWMIEKFNRHEMIMKLKNGSVITFKSCDSGAGKFQSADVDVVHFDEEPPYDIYKEALARTIDRSGLIYLTMTPVNGISWSYEHIFKKADGKKIKVFQVSTHDNPYLNKDDIEAITDEWGEEESLMRIQGDYITLGAKKVFTAESLQSAKDNLKPPEYTGDIFEDPQGRPTFLEHENGKLRIWEPPLPGARYYMGVDATEGINDLVGVVVKKETARGLEQVAEYGGTLPPEIADQKVYYLAQFYNEAFVTVERNGGGIAVLIGLLNRNYMHLYLNEKEEGGAKDGMFSTKFGHHTDLYSKLLLVKQTRKLLREKRVIIRSEDLWTQMAHYVEDERGRMRASTGHDDYVLAELLCNHGYMSEQSPVYSPARKVNTEGNPIYAEKRNQVSYWVSH